MLQQHRSSWLLKGIGRGYVRFLFALVVGLVLAAWLLVTADFCSERARIALMNSQWSAADHWLKIGGYCRGSRGKLWLIRARLFIKRGRLPNFESTLQNAKASGVSDNTIFRERLIASAAGGQIEPLRERLGQLLAAGEDLPEICEAYVLGCLSSYRLDEAAQIIQLWQSDFPRDPRPHLLNGRLLEHRSDYQHASAEFQTAWNLSQNYAPAAFNLARIYTTQNQYEEAEKWYRLAANSLEEPQPALIGQARCLRELGRNDEARLVLQSAIARPSTGQAYEDAYRIVGESMEAAAAQLDAEIGKLELASKHYASACESFSKALAANPRDWRTRYSYSVALRQAGQNEQADVETTRVEAAKAALNACDLVMDRLQKNSQDVEARYIVGAAILDHVSENQGLIWLNSVLAIDPHHAPTHRKLAEYFAANGNGHPDFDKQAEWHRKQAEN